MLNRCIGTDPQEFARKHWGQLPLLTRSDALPRDFGDLLTPAGVDELLAERGVRAPFIRVAQDGRLLDRADYLGPAGFGAEITDQVDTAKLLGRFAAGASIVLQGLHRLWPPLIDFVRALVDDLGHPVQANAYVTPPGSRGFDPHYDVHDVFVLQVSGSKHWAIHRPVHVDPLDDQPWTDHRSAIEQRAGDDPFLDTTLHEGDALYLPRGWLHSARSMDALSIHLTIGVATLTRMDVIRAVVDQLADLDEFRGSLAMGGDPSDRDQMASAATKIVAQLTDVLRDRTTELSDGAARRLSDRHAARTRPVAVRPLATLDALADAATVAVRWRHGLVGTLETVGDRVLLRLPDRTIAFPGSCAAALAAVHACAVVTASTLPGLDVDDGAVVVRRLLREAVVVPAG
jgi:bifunctional lysine-specific demethylase and histidyl-hydroxylase NO66